MSCWFIANSNHQKSIKVGWERETERETEREGEREK